MRCEFSTQIYDWVPGWANFPCVGVSLVAPRVASPTGETRRNQLPYRVASPVMAFSTASRVRKAFGDRVTGASMMENVVKTCQAQGCASKRAEDRERKKREREVPYFRDSCWIDRTAGSLPPKQTGPIHADLSLAGILRQQVLHVTKSTIFLPLKENSSVSLCGCS